MRSKTLLRLSLITLFSISIICAKYSIDLRDAELYANQKIDLMHEAQAIKSEIDHHITLNIKTVEALAGVVKINREITQEEFIALSKEISNKESGAIELQLTKGTIITHISQIPDRFNSLGLDLKSNKSQIDSIEHTAQHDTVHIDGPFPMKGAPRNIIIIRNPIFIGEEFYGFAMYLVDFDRLISTTKRKNRSAIRTFKKGRNGTATLYGDVTLFENTNNITIDIPFRDNRWQVALEFTPKLSSLTFKAIVYTFSMLFAASCSLIIYLALKFRSLSIRDPLTGSYNRRHLQKIYKEHVAEFALSFDIDHFKKINDKYGHDVGDQAIIKFCTAIKNSIRPHDHLFRIGGEEFLVIIHVKTNERALQIAERVRNEVLNIKFRESFSISTSIGLTQIQNNESLHSLLVRIDGLLYSAKKNGRNRVEHDFSHHIKPTKN